MQDTLAAASPSNSAVSDVENHSPERTPGDRRLALINLGAVVIPFLGLIAAIVLLWGVAFDWVQLVILWIMSTITAFGVTVGYHRLCTHKSFTTPPLVRYLFAAAGSMAVQGPVIKWCAEHRRHHQHSDTERDPHSPHMSPDGSWGEGFLALLRGAYHAHVGWLFTGRCKGLGKYSVDLRNDPILVRADREFPLWVIAGLVIPSVLGGIFTLTWTGALLGFLWGGLVRILLVHHITWSVNSVCHLWGTQPFKCRDHSRNNLLVGILAMGEGWHNNHHAFPTSARHGLYWWELDLSYLLIRAMQFVGLARDVRCPDPQRIEQRRRATNEAPEPTHLTGG